MKNAKLHYHSGDSVGIFAQNDPTLVAHLIEAMGASPEQEVVAKRAETKMRLQHFLTNYANLSRLTSAFLRFIHKHYSSADLEDLLLDRKRLRVFLANNDPLFLLRDYANSRLPLQELCDQFGPLLPRFYSVASSKILDPHTLDLTVSLFTWTQGEEKRYGVASHFLCHLAEMETTPVPLYVQPARHFRLPEDHSKDIIMIGPGTGIAPFRAFMQERSHHRATGRHWLFFGERNQKTDFLYQSEWDAHKNLRLHTAFSRDQEEKVYVQHKMQESAEELFDWLEGGAHLYVCGDAKFMAKDVDKTLHEIVAKVGGFSEADAKKYIKDLKATRRYLLDVY